MPHDAAPSAARPCWTRNTPRLRAGTLEDSAAFPVKYSRWGEAPSTTSAIAPGERVRQASLRRNKEGRFARVMQCEGGERCREARRGRVSMIRPTSMTAAAWASSPMSRACARTRHHRPGPPDPRQSRPSRRRRRRSRDGRRRRLPDPDSRRAVPRLGRAASGSTCRRPATMRSRCASCRATRRAAPPRSSGSSASIAHRGPAAARLARGAGRRRRARRRGARGDAGDPPGDRRPRARTCATRTRSSASCWRSASRPRTRWRDLAAKTRPAGPRRLLHRVAVEPDAGLQGHAARPLRSAASTATSRDPLTRLGAGDGPPAFLDQHLPVLAAGPPVSGSSPIMARSTRCAAT